MAKHADTLEDFMAATDSDDESPVKKNNKKGSGLSSTTTGLNKKNSVKDLLSRGKGTTGKNEETTDTSRQVRSSMVGNLSSTAGSFFGASLGTSKKDTFSSFLERASSAVQKAKEGEYKKETKKKDKSKNETSDKINANKEIKKSQNPSDKSNQKQNEKPTEQKPDKKSDTLVTKQFIKTEDFTAYGETDRKNPIRESTISMRLDSDDEDLDEVNISLTSMSQGKDESMQFGSFAGNNVTNSGDSFMKDFEPMDSMNTEEFEKEIMKDFHESDYENSISDLQDSKEEIVNESKKLDVKPSTSNQQQKNIQESQIPFKKETELTKPSTSKYEEKANIVKSTNIKTESYLESKEIKDSKIDNVIDSRKSNYNPQIQRIIDISEYDELKKNIRDLRFSKENLEDEIKRLKNKNEDLKMKFEIDIQEKDATVASLREEKNRIREEYQEKFRNIESEFMLKEKNLKKELEEAKTKLHEDHKEFRLTLKTERSQWKDHLKKLEADHKKEISYLKEISETTLAQKNANDSSTILEMEATVKEKFETIIKKLQNDNSDLQIQISKQRSENIEFRDKLEEVKDELESSTKKIKRWEEKYSTLEKEFNALHEEKEKIIIKNKELLLLNEQPDVTLLSAKKQAESLLENTEDENKKLTQKVKDLEYIIQSMKYEHEEEIRKIEKQESEKFNQTHRLEEAERNATIKEKELKQTIEILNTTLSREQLSNTEEISRMRKTIDKLRDEKKEAEREMFEVKRLALQKEQQTILQLENKIQSMEVAHNAEIKSLRNKLQWYAENQELLENQQKRISDLQRYTQELEKKLRKMETDESPDNPLVHKYSDRIKQLENELETQTKKQKNPNSISQLIRATKEDDVQVQKLNSRIKELERLLEQAQQDSQTSLRSLRQETDKIQLQLEEQVKSFKKKFNDEKAKCDELKEKLVSLEKQLKKETSKSQELQQNVEDTKTFYRKKLADMEKELKEKEEKNRSSTSKSKSTIDFSSTQRIAELENELKLKDLQLSKMEKVNLVKQPKDNSLKQELEQVKNQNIHLKAQNDLLISQRSNWMKDESSLSKEHAKRVSDLEQQLRETQTTIELIKKSKEESLELKEKVVRDLRQSLQDAIDMKERLIKDYEYQMNELKRGHQITIDKLNREHSEELLKNSPDERDRERLRKIEEMLTKISDLESNHRKKESELNREINELKYQMEIEQIRSKQTYDVMLQRKNAEVMKFKMALDSLTTDIRRMRQLGYMKRQLPHHTIQNNEFLRDNVDFDNLESGTRNQDKQNNIDMSNLHKPKKINSEIVSHNGKQAQLIEGVANRTVIPNPLLGHYIPSQAQLNQQQLPFYNLVHTQAKDFESGQQLFKKVFPPQFQTKS